MTLERLTPERRRAMTRRHLLEAAAIVFARDGFHGSTLDEVAATAGFTKGAVYANFKSKDDLFLALLNDRTERQFAVITEVLESTGHEGRRPRVRELLHSGAFVSDETWDALYLEFVLYARRNPEAAAKLSARSDEERDFVRQMIEHEHSIAGVTPRYPTDDLATISLALFAGLGTLRLNDPSALSETILDTVLDVLSESMDIDETSPERSSVSADGSHDVDSDRR